MSEDADSITSLSFQATLCLPPSSPYLPTLSAKMLWEIWAGGGRCGGENGNGNHIYISRFIQIFLKRATQASHSISGLASNPLLHRVLPHNSHLLRSQLWCHLACGPSIELTSSCSPSGPQASPCQSQSLLLPPATQRDCPFSLPMHSAWHLAQSKPTTTYSIFPMPCRAAAKVGSSELVPTLSWPVPALGTWRPVLTPLQQHLPVESNFWRPVRV